MTLRTRTALTITAIAIAGGGVASLADAGRPPPPPEDPPPTGPVTTVSWVGDTITITGDGGDNHVRVRYAQTEGGDGPGEYTILTSCTEDFPCSEPGRFYVAGAAAAGDDGQPGCGGRDGRYVSCYPIGRSNPRRIVVKLGDGKDEIVTSFVRIYHHISVDGGTGNDVLYTDHVDEVLGGVGDDTLDGGGNGGPGNDKILGEGNGGPGADLLSAGRLGAFLNGGSGPDRLIGSPHEDRLDGGKGRDFCDGRKGRSDRAIRCEVVKGVP